MLMRADRIQKGLDDRLITIEGYSDEALQPASYNFRLGDEAITCSQREMVDPSRRGLLVIPAGDFALVKTFERVALSTRVAGPIGLRSHYAKRGLDILAGPQIDPGFEGYLVVGLTNLSPRDITIGYKTEFCTVEFHEFSDPVSTPYSGEYQGPKGITGPDLEALVESQGMTFGEVIRSLGALSASVNDLSHWAKVMAWAVPLVVTIGFVVIGIVVSVKKLRPTSSLSN